MSYLNACIEGLRLLSGMVFTIMLATASALALAGSLQEGDWSGSYTPYHSNTLETVYEVRYSEQDEARQLSITMIIDLEPRSDFTYVLEDIVVKDDKITFKIKKTQETKVCELVVQENGDYLGQCQSDIDTEGKHLTSILMIPPPVNEQKKEGEE